MLSKPFSKIYLKMFFYIILTMVITFCSLIENMDLEKLKALTHGEWFKMAIKTILPALISLKAYLDDTISVSSKDSEEQETLPEKIEKE